MKFPVRRNTIPYRLKSHSGLIKKILGLLALGVDTSALEEVFRVREITIRTRLCRSGLQGKKLHERFIAELTLVHVQLDELWANVKENSPGNVAMGGNGCKSNVITTDKGWTEKKFSLRKLPLQPLAKRCPADQPGFAFRAAPL
jgi:hypothetical protein